MREFWSLPFAVGSGVLVPRPDSELLVELASRAVGPGGSPFILDLGTGSGAIGLSLAHELPAARVDLVDNSKEALAFAQHNARALSLDNVTLYLGDWYEPLPPERAST